MQLGKKEPVGKMEGEGKAAIYECQVCINKIDNKQGWKEEEN